MLGKKCFEFWGDSKKPCKCCPTYKAIKSGNSHHAVITSQDGRIWDNSAEPVYDNAGTLIGAVEISRDITERKNIEKALLKSQEIGKNGTWKLDIKKDILIWSNEVYRIFDIPCKTKMNSELFMNCIHPDDRDYVLMKWNEGMNHNPYDIEHRIIVNGKIKWIREKADIHYDIEGDPIYAIGFIQDITDEKEYQRKIIESQREKEEILNSINDGFFVLDDDLTVTYFNSAAEKILGKKQEHVIGKKLFSAFPEAKGSAFEENYLKSIRERKSVVFETLFDVPPYANWYSVKTYPLKKGISVYFRTITEQKEAEQNLMEEKAFTESIITSMIDGLWVIDKNMKTTYVNIALTSMLGYSEEEMINMPPAMLIPEENRTDCREGIKAVLSGESSEVPNQLHICKDGSLINCRLTTSPIKDYNGNITGALAVYKDITEEEKAKEMLIQNQRLKSMGELSAGIAHDFNNTLQRILLGIDMVLLDKGVSQKSISYLHGMKRSVEGSSERIKGLLEFSNRRDLEDNKYCSNIAEIFDSTINQITPLINELSETKNRIINIKCENLFKSYVSGSKGELQDVFYNLFKNSIDAMPYGGEIRIETRLKEESIIISVSDNGIGMDDNTASKVFEPFFTTKEIGKGTGLGLSAAFGIIRNIGGNIFIKYTKVDKGTTFEIELPLTSYTIHEEEKSKRSMKPYHAKILWVDDDKDIREIGETLLRLIGYDTTAAESGKKALEYLKNSKYDMVITDIGMPEMDGWQLIGIIKKRYPGIKIAVLSGWGSNITEAELEQKGVSMNRKKSKK